MAASMSTAKESGALPYATPKMVEQVNCSSVEHVQVSKATDGSSSSVKDGSNVNSLTGLKLVDGLALGKYIRQAKHFSIYAVESSNSQHQNLQANVFDLRGKSQSQKRFINRVIAQQSRKSSNMISYYNIAGIFILVPVLKIERLGDAEPTNVASDQDNGMNAKALEPPSSIKPDPDPISIIVQMLQTFRLIIHDIETGHPNPSAPKFWSLPDGSSIFAEGHEKIYNRVERPTNSATLNLSPHDRTPALPTSSLENAMDPPSACKTKDVPEKRRKHAIPSERALDFVLKLAKRITMGEPGDCDNQRIWPGSGFFCRELCASPHAGKSRQSWARHLHGISQQLPDLLEKKTKEKQELWHSSIPRIRRLLQKDYEAAGVSSASTCSTTTSQGLHGLTLDTREITVKVLSEYLSWTVDATFDSCDFYQTDVWMGRLILQYRMFSVELSAPPSDTSDELECIFVALLKSFSICQIIQGAIPIIEQWLRVAEENARRWGHFEPSHKDWSKLKAPEESFIPNPHKSFNRGSKRHKATSRRA